MGSDVESLMFNLTLLVQNKKSRLQNHKLQVIFNCSLKVLNLAINGLMTCDNVPHQSGRLVQICLFHDHIDCYSEYIAMFSIIVIFDHISYEYHDKTYSTHHLHSKTYFICKPVSLLLSLSNTLFQHLRIDINMLH